MFDKNKYLKTLVVKLSLSRTFSPVRPSPSLIVLSLISMFL